MNPRKVTAHRDPLRPDGHQAKRRTTQTRPTPMHCLDPSAHSKPISRRSLLDDPSFPQISTSQWFNCLGDHRDKRPLQRLPRANIRVARHTRAPWEVVGISSNVPCLVTALSRLRPRIISWVSFCGQRVSPLGSPGSMTSGAMRSGFDRFVNSCHTRHGAALIDLLPK